MSCLLFYLYAQTYYIPAFIYIYIYIYIYFFPIFYFIEIGYNIQIKNDKLKIHVTDESDKFDINIDIYYRLFYIYKIL